MAKHSTSGWIESHLDVGRNRKILALARQLGISVPQTVGHLHLFWHTVLEQQEDGDVSKWTPEAVAEAAQFHNSDEKFFYNALLAQHLLDELDGHVVVHDWFDYAGRYLEAKYRRGNPKLLKKIRRVHHAGQLPGNCRAIAGPYSRAIAGPYSRAIAALPSGPSGPSGPIKDSEIPPLPPQGGVVGGAQLLEEFAAWWKSYPRKLGKHGAERRWGILRRTRSVEELTAARDKFLAAMSREKRPLDKLPYGSTFLTSQIEDWLDGNEPADTGGYRRLGDSRSADAIAPGRHPLSSLKLEPYVPGVTKMDWGERKEKTL